MADIILNKPEAGTQAVFEAAGDSRIDLNFPTDQATLERSGNDLIFRFDDGGTVALRDFYTAYTKESMPDFVIEGTPIAGEQFFMALNEPDLMPAAGPAANASNADGGRFREYTDATLIDGVNRLDGLDLSSSRAFFPERDPWGGLRGNDTPNFEPILSVSGSLNLIESGVFPGGNTPYEGIPSMSGSATGTDGNGDSLSFGFIDANGAQVSSITTPYGVMTMAPDGTYTYTLDNADPDTNGLARGETRTETFTIYVSDGRGGLATQEITVTITGTNDRPELSIADAAQPIHEDTASVGGSFEVEDPDSDSGQNQTFHIAGGKTTDADGKVHDTTGTAVDGSHTAEGSTPATFTTDYGKLTLDPATGQWTYELDNTNEEIQQLNAGEKKFETFDVTVTDEHGATSTQTITVTITGTNDIPVIDTEQSGFHLAFKEQGVYQPTEGGDGNAPTTGDGIGEGQHQTGTLSGKIYASDIDKENGAGSTDHDVNKLNFHVEHAGSSLTDSDGGAPTTVTGTGTPGTGDIVYTYESAYGTLTFHADGSYEYTLKSEADSDAVNNLALGQTVTETFTVYVTDAQTGKSEPQTITVTIHGTNDIPTLDLSNDNLNGLLGGDGLHVVEDGVGREDANTPTNDPGKENAPFTGHTTDTGTATGNDADAGHILYFGAAAGDKANGAFDPSVKFNTADSTATGNEASSVVANGQYGSLTIKSDGSYTYAMKGEDENVSFEIDGKTYTSLDQLAEGDTIHETFTIYVRDEHNAWTSQTVTVTIHGTNDIPTLEIKGEDWNITQGGELSIGGTFTVSDNDRDAGENQTFHIEGGKATGADGKEHDTIGTAAEGSHTAEGSTSATFETEYGKLILDPATGEWTYEAKPDAIQGLGKDETKIETFEVTVTDEHGATSTEKITVTLTGKNDAPRLNGAAIELKEQGVYDTVNANTPTTEHSGGTGIGDSEHQLSIEGKLDASDLDLNDKLIYGIKGLKEGDGPTADSLTVEIKGSDPDAPKTVEVEVTSSSIDPATHIQTIETNYGTLTLNTQTGEFTFDISGSDDADELAQGEELTFNFHTTVDDGNGGTADSVLTVTIKGTNDRPTLDLAEPSHGDNVTAEIDDQTGEVTFNITEKADAPSDTTVSGTLKSEDDDRGANLLYGVAHGKQDVESEAGRNEAFASGSDGKPGMGEPLHQVGDKIVIEGEYGTLTIDPKTNTYTYTTNEKADQLGLDKDGTPQTGTDEFTIYVRDEHGAWTAKPVSFTVTGSNDTPTITADATEHWVKEAGALDTSTAHGTTTDTKNTADTSDDSRELTGDDTTLSRNEISGQVHVKDTDADDTLTLSIGAKEGSGTILIGAPKTDANGNITLETEFGSIILHKDGTYTYTIDEGKTQSLKQGQTEKESFTITVDDGHGGKASVDITINIVGSNDRPTLELAPTSDTIVSDPGYDKDNNEVAGDLTVTGTFKGADPDSDHSLEFGVSTTPGNRDTAFHAGDDNTPGMGEGIHTVKGTYGTLTLDPSNGTYTYTLDTTKNGAADKLGLDKDGNPETGTDEFTIYVRDEHGAWSEKTITVTVNGSNDMPIVTSTGETLTLREEGYDGYDPEKGNIAVDSKDMLTGKVEASDADANDTLTYFFSDKNHNPITFEVGDKIGTLTLADGTKSEISITGVGQEGNEIIISTDYGDFRLDTTNGKYSFTKAEETRFENGKEVLDDNPINDLQIGDKVELDFTISVKDDHGAVASDTHDVKVEIDGSNDLPYAKMADIYVKEEGVYFHANKGHGGNTATTEGNTSGETHKFSGKLEVTGLKDVDDDVSVGLGLGDGQFKLDINLMSAGRSYCSELVYTLNEDETVGTWTTHPLLSNGADYERVMAALFSDNFPKDVFAELEEALKADGLLGEGEALTYGNAGRILPNVELGTLTVNTKGEYTFELPPDGSAGSILVDTFKQGSQSGRPLDYTITDPHGGVYSGSFNIVIKGTNDRPELTLDSNDDRIMIVEKTTNDGKTVTEEAQIEMNEDGDAFVGKAHGTDVDSGSTLTYGIAGGHIGNADSTDVTDLQKAFDDKPGEPGKSDDPGMGDPCTEVQGKHGVLTINPETGEYTYTPTDDSLVLGSEHRDEFTIFVRDEHGAWSQQHITFIVKGDADVPVLVGKAPDANVIELTEAGVVGNKDVSGSLHIKGEDQKTDPFGDAPNGYELGSFTVKQIDTVGTDETAAGELIAGFVVGNEFHVGDLETPYGTLHAEAVKGEDGTYEVVYSFIPPEPGSQEAKNLDALNEGERKELFEDLKVGVYDSAHESLVKGDANGEGSFNIKDGDLVLTQDVQIHINGTNDRPFFTDKDGKPITEITIGTGELEEDGNHTITGNLNAHDPDAGHSDALTYSIVGNRGQLEHHIQGKYGILELKEDGSYTYTITNPKLLDALNKGETLIGSVLEQEAFTIRVEDPKGAYSTGKLVIDVTGSADIPIVKPGAGTVVEDDIPESGDDEGLPSVSGKLELEGVVDAEDKGEGELKWTVSNEVTDKEGNPVDEPLGTLTINKDGTYTYVLTKNGEDIVQSMNEGNSKTEVFKVQVETKGGKLVDTEITITINGTNDAPEFAAEVTGLTGGVVKQDAFVADGTADNPGLVYKGTILGWKDIDDTDVRFMLVGENEEPVTELKTDYGTIVLTYEEVTDNAGNIINVITHYTYTLDNESDALRKKLSELGEGESLWDTVQVVVVDAHGGVSKETRKLTIEIKQPDDKEPGGVDVKDPGNEYTGEVYEDGDREDTPEVESTVVEGQLKAEWDGEGPEGVEAPNRVFGIEETDAEGNGTGNQIQSNAASGKYGVLVIDPVTGKYTYTLHNGENGEEGPVQNLAAGQVVEETFKVMLNGKVTDSTITITIRGTNDAPVITSEAKDLSLKVQEDAEKGFQSMEGTLKAEDIDYILDGNGNPALDGNGDARTETETLEWFFRDKDGNLVKELETEYGKVTLKVDEGGECTYVYTPNVDHLIEGETLPDSFTVTVRDQHGETVDQEINVTIKGTNTGPKVIGEQAPLSVQEDVTTTVSGKLDELISDDEGLGLDNLTYSINGQGMVAEGKYGTLHIDPATGKYVYTLNNADPTVQGLSEADGIQKEHFTLTVTDKHGKTVEVEITVNVEGSDDAPLLSLGGALYVREGAGAIDGTAIGSDKDDADKGHLTYSFEGAETVKNEYGTFAVIKNEYGEFRINTKTGEYTFTLNNESEAVLEMEAGKLYEVKVPVTVTDTSGLSDTKELTVTIEGTNTAPIIKSGEKGVIEANAENPLIEDSGKTQVTGKVEAHDYDGEVANYMFVNDKGELVSTIEGKYGSITINKDGTYTYTFDNGKAQHLGAGELAVDGFKVVAVDNYGAQTTNPSELQISIQGTNDAPVITSAAPTLNLTEPSEGAEGTAQATGRIEFTDADKKADGSFHDTHTFSVKREGAEGNGGPSAEGKYGTLTIDEHGNYKYVLTSDALGEGEKATETFTVTVDDGNKGGTATQTITVNLTGTNDAPEITGSQTDNGTMGSFTFTDADVNDKHSLAVSIGGKTYDVTLNPEGTSGTAAIDGLGTFTLTKGEGGAWNYTFTPSAEAQAGAELGKIVKHDFQITVSDGHATVTTPTGSLSVSFMGTGINADMPLDNLMPDMTHSSTLPGTDAHENALAYTFDNAQGGDIQGTFGTLHFDAETGRYTYTLDTSEEGLHKLAEAQAHGSDLKESFEYTVNGTSNGSLEINLTNLHTFLGGEGTDSLGDPNAPHSQVLFGEGGDDALHGGSGNDWLFGGDGDDQIFGGMGDDTLFGGAGNDYLDGGTGQNALYGGKGNDILVYNQGMAHASGGEGIDFLVGADRDTLDSLFADKDNNPIQSDIEVFITSKPDSLSLTSMDDLKNIGISIEDDKLHLSGDWKPTADGNGEPGTSLGNYAEFTNGNGTTILVQADTLASEDLTQQLAQNALAHGQG